MAPIACAGALQLLAGSGYAASSAGAGARDAEAQQPHVLEPNSSTVYSGGAAGARTPTPNYWLTGLELGLALGAGAAWYVIDDRNVLDWDKPSLKERLNGEAWRFDNNGFAINFIFHPLSGAAFHALARSNELGFWSSSATSLIGSTLWEYVIEFNEKVSINDMMVTPGAGMLIGEFAHKLGVYLNASPSSSVGQDVLRWTFGPSVSLNDALNDRARHQQPWHDFSLQYQLGWLQAGPHIPSSHAIHHLRFHGTLVSLPGYRARGALTRWFWSGEVSRLELDLMQARGGLDGHLSAENLLAGWHHQQLESPRSGLAVTAGVNLGYRYRNSQAQGFDDRQGALQFPGPGIDLFVGADGITAELRARASFDFAGISSLAAPGWLREHAGDQQVRTKTIIERERYFYGWGPSASLTLRLRAGPVWVEGRAHHSSYDSAEGLDRTQERITHDADFDEITTEYEYLFGLAMVRQVGVAAFRKVNHRLSYAGAASASVRAEELGLVIDVSF